jgi:predicted PurR-regulated permease PerM
LLSSLLLAALSIAAALGGAPHAAGILGLFLAVALSATILDCARATGSAKRAAESLEKVAGYE